MRLFLALFAYATALTAANISVYMFGPWITPINSFLFIGFDLTMRDWLHTRIRPWQMAALIVFAGALTLVLAPNASMIAIASAVSFMFANAADWAVFAKMKGSWIRRANGSNAVGAAVDSFMFPLIAFGALLPHIVLLQFIAKIGGGAFWAYLFALTMRKAKA